MKGLLTSFRQGFRKAVPFGRGIAPGPAAAARSTSLCALAAAALGLGASPALAADCPNESVRAQQRLSGLPSLPDCRAYEQVSPVDKNGYPVFFVGNRAPTAGFTGAAPDGATVAFSSWGSFAGSTHAAGPQPYRSRRTAAGWVTTATAPAPTVAAPNSIYFDGRVSWVGASPDLDYGLTVTNNRWSTSDENENSGFGLEGLDAYVTGPDGEVELASVGDDGLASGSVVDVGSTERPNLISDDGQDVVFTTTNSVVAGDTVPAGLQRVYGRSDGRTYMIGIGPDGTVVGEECGTSTAVASGWETVNTEALSADGETVYFQTRPRFAFACGEPARLFVRVNAAQPQSPIAEDGSCADPELACTLEVSATRRAVPDPAGPSEPVFMRASADGSRVIFYSQEALTEDASLEPGRQKVYEFEVGSDTLRLLFEVAGAEVIKTAKSLERLYVLTVARLTEDAPEVDSQPDLYYWESGQFHYLAAGEPVTGPLPPMSSALTSHDGDTLAFLSAAGYGVGETNGNGQIYLYRDGHGLACVSCLPPGSGASSSARAEMAMGDGTQTSASREQYASSLSADGTRLVFASRDALLPGDTNNRYDVYQWTAEGVGTCLEAATAGGCLSLISSGQDSENSYVLGISRDGRDIFFSTSQSLVGQDGDRGNIDIYDARTGGGFLEPEAATAAPPCQGEECQAAAPPPPPAAAPGSARVRAPDAGERKPCKKAAKRKAARRCPKNRKKKGSARAAAPTKRAGGERGGAK